MKLHEIANTARIVTHVKREPKRVEVWAKERTATKWQGYILAWVIAYTQEDGSSQDYLNAVEVYVDPAARKRGLGTALYDTAERVMGLRMLPTDALSDEAIAFWKKRDPTISNDDFEEWGYGDFTSYDPNFKIPQP